MDPTSSSRHRSFHAIFIHQSTTLSSPKSTISQVFSLHAAAAAAAKSLQSCSTLCDPIDGSPPGIAVPGILQARTLEWVAISSPMHEREVAQSCLTPSGPPGLQPTRLLCPWDLPGKSTCLEFSAPPRHISSGTGAKKWPLVHDACI